MEELNIYIESGIKKVKNKKIKVFVLAVLAGMFIALAGYASTVISYKVQNPSLSKALSALVFPIGLILVVLMKTELFTGNNLLVIPVLNKKIKIKELLINWIIVYIGNLIGSILVAFLIYETKIFESNTDLLNAFVSVANKKISYTFVSNIILGFFCNILVCIAVYLATTMTKTIEKIMVIIFPIFLFILLGFEHSVANMYYLTQALLVHKFSISQLLLNNLLPVTIGNIIGGICLSLIIYYTKKQ